jgi:hypothetical protein
MRKSASSLKSCWIANSRESTTHRGSTDSTDEEEATGTCEDDEDKDAVSGTTSEGTLDGAEEVRSIGTADGLGGTKDDALRRVFDEEGTADEGGAPELRVKRD